MTLREKLTHELINVMHVIPLYQRESLQAWVKFTRTNNPDDMGAYVKALTALVAKQELMEFLTDILEPE